MDIAAASTGYERWLEQRASWVQEPLVRRPTRRISSKRRDSIQSRISFSRHGELPEFCGLAEVVQALEKMWLRDNSLRYRTYFQVPDSSDSN